MGYFNNNLHSGRNIEENDIHDRHQFFNKKCYNQCNTRLDIVYLEKEKRKCYTFKMLMMFRVCFYFSQLPDEKLST